MLSFEQFRELISNLKSLCEYGYCDQCKTLLSLYYGDIISCEIISFINNEARYSLKEIYNLIDDNCTLISRYDAYTLLELNKLYPNNDMFNFFQKYISEHE